MTAITWKALSQLYIGLGRSLACAYAREHLLDMRDGCFGKNAVPQIKDAGAPGEVRKICIDGAIERVAASEQDQRIELALQRQGGRDFFAHELHVHRPVETNRIDRNILRVIRKAAPGP